MPVTESVEYRCDWDDCEVTLKTDAAWHHPMNWGRLLAPTTRQRDNDLWFCPEHAQALIHAVRRPGVVARRAG